ncbi:hypothetical protein MFRU_007g01140 [Monilinia fructicola]|uniref:Seipin n=1 Tax=Monilinia fructicola TaxID=38448 RepID=A0A5M9JG63_MONFR|nr:hypothetical protein EYC84_010045 [Monilinia fructicola]KAG4032203.1 hypothetical protein MFRU_007g01140 [Monilinia fructicola]
MDTIIRNPIAIATSKPARKTYLNTILFLTTSLVLFGFAVLAYAGFYWSWVPAVGVERKVWLQFAPDQHPHGIVTLDNSLVTRQEYDIQLELHMPRSPLNLRAGNFMVHVNFLGSAYRTPSSIPGVEHLLPLSRITKNEDVLFSSRRPTILTYESELISGLGKLVNAPLYVLGWKREDEKILVDMAEGVSFPRGNKNVPRAVEVVVEKESGEIQIYGCRIVMRAKLSGLRWWMWNWRIGSAIVGVGTFWGAEMLGCIVGWGILKLCFEGRKEKLVARDKEVGKGGDIIKQEATDDEPDLSDTPRTFPTVRRQMPLVYPPVGMKKEEEEEEKILEETVILPLGGDADDEDEQGEGSWQAGRRSDSGLGTSFSEAGVGSSGRVSRRRSRGGPVNGL